MRAAAAAGFRQHPRPLLHSVVKTADLIKGGYVGIHKELLSQFVRKIVTGLAL